MQKKIGIAMSGGVDSTVSAALLKKYGHDVSGFFMLLPLPGLDKQLRKVQEIADQLAIPLTLVDLRDQFSRSVIQYFLDAYRQGLTPNPCIFCNRHIKFGLFVDHMCTHGMQMVATGHYARLRRFSGKTYLYRSPDDSKDQSYFLCRLTDKQLSRLIFPLSNWTKEETYQQAKEFGFRFQDGESQDVCFLKDDLVSFLKSYGFQEETGEIVDPAGNYLGDHKGMWRYTIGQRRGLGIPDATPWYVVALDANNNRVIAGKNESLRRTSLTVHSLQWNDRPSIFPRLLSVQLRSRHRPAVARILLLGRNRGALTFRHPQRAITPGQYAVLYDGDKLIGSGIIE